jgi:D-glycero-alpha-D-manno-heptose 1-phosphate guanylyltransferase
MKINAIILVGGKGTRLQSVLADKPKPLAPVLGRPFLAHLLDRLAVWDRIDEVVLSSGYLSKQIEDFITEHRDRYPFLLKSLVEKEPLGTGGAIFYAAEHCRSDQIIVLNGDTIFEVDLENFLDFHLKRSAWVSLAAHKASEEQRFGSVSIKDDGCIVQFKEKAALDSSQSLLTPVINGGIYLFDRSKLPVLHPAVGSSFSIEADVFSKLTSEKFFAFKSEGRFIDIGTPQSLIEAEDFLQNSGVRYNSFSEDRK